MTDVSGLVRIDIGVLNDRLAGDGIGVCSCKTSEEAEGVDRAVQPDVQVTIARNFQIRDTFHRTKLFGKLRGNALWSLFQLACQLEGNRDGQLTKFALFGLLEGDRNI